MYDESVFHSWAEKIPAWIKVIKILATQSLFASLAILSSYSFEDCFFPALFPGCSFSTSALLFLFWLLPKRKKVERHSELVTCFYPMA